MGATSVFPDPYWFHWHGSEVQDVLVKPIFQAYSTLKSTAATWLQVEPSLLKKSNVWYLVTIALFTLGEKNILKNTENIQKCTLKSP